MSKTNEIQERKPDILVDIDRLLDSGYEVYIRVLTREELIANCSMGSKDRRPHYWNSAGQMDNLFGEVVRVFYTVFIQGLNGVRLNPIPPSKPWFIRVGDFELLNEPREVPSNTPNKISSDDIKDYLQNRFNKHKV